MKRWQILGVTAAMTLGSVVPIVANTARPAGATAPTIVSLNFDDGFASQSVAPSMLDAHGMKGTFYVNSNTIGIGGFLSWANLTAYQADGHEIAGHTLDHLDLSTISLDQVNAQVCQDRTNLINHGFAATDFAYPYGHGYDDPTIVSIIKGCGYSSARRAWGLYSSDPSCGNDGCGYPYANSVPPDDPYAIPTGDNPESGTTVAQIEQLVTQAEQHGGGWVPIVFHYICDGCSPYSTTQANLQAFLDWLQPRSAQGTVVETMNQVLDGSTAVDTTPPATTIACNGGSCGSLFSAPVSVSLAATDNAGGSGVAVTRYTTNGADPTQSGAGATTYTGAFTVSATTTVKYASWDNAGNMETVHTQVVSIGSGPPPGNLVQNPSLETPTGATAVPDCWQQGSAGTNTATWSHTSDAHTGNFAEQVTISAYTSGDRKIVQTQDSGTCAPAISAGHSYQLSEWYKGSGNDRVHDLHAQCRGHVDLLSAELELPRVDNVGAGHAQLDATDDE